MRYICWIAFGFMIAFVGELKGQAVPMRLVTALPTVLTESSGLIQTAPNRLWSHNDSGSEPKLYQFDTTGTLLRTLVLKNVTNADWEELTQDANGNVYVGDFGNNNNTRTNLKIYKIPNPDGIVGDSVMPQVIAFNYPDQMAFPPADSLLNFDMEAMVAKGDSLYLFSKNRTNPFNGISKMYRLPQDSGTYVAELIDFDVTCNTSMFNCWISGAALSPNGEHLILLAYGKFWLYSCFDNADFLAGEKLMRNIAFSQTEAVAWKDSTHLYITDELLNGTFGRNLYELSIANLLLKPEVSLGNDTLIYAGDSLLIGNSPQAGMSYLWNTGQTTAQIVVQPSQGIYTYILEVTAVNGCKVDDTINLQVLTGLENSKELNLKCGPNPFQERCICVWHSNELAEFSWRLIDLNGWLIEEGQGFEKRMEIGSGCLPGFYVLEYWNNSGVKHKKKLLKK